MFNFDYTTLEHKLLTHFKPWQVDRMLRLHTMRMHKLDELYLIEKRIKDLENEMMEDINASI